MKEKKKSDIAVLLDYAGKPSELLKKNGSVFKRMAKLQSESAGWSLVR